MPRSYGEVLEIAVQGLGRAVDALAGTVPPPAITRTPSGSRAHRYREMTTQQALVLKSVRLYSALVAGVMLLHARLSLDVGATMRTLDEIGSDIQFLSGPAVTGTLPEPRHAEFLAEFFQEEFDNPDPLKATQKRMRVSRRDIRAYVARTFQAGFDVSQIVATTSTIDNMNSGFVHGAAVHTMDVFDGRRFTVPTADDDPRLADMRETFLMYIHRALMDVAMAAKAVGAEDEFQTLYRLTTGLFDDAGRVK
jgi:hypothetical protein